MEPGSDGARTVGGGPGEGVEQGLRLHEYPERLLDSSRRRRPALRPRVQAGEGMTPEELRLAEAYRVALRIRLHRLAKHLPLDPYAEPAFGGPLPDSELGWAA